LASKIGLSVCGTTGGESERSMIDGEMAEVRSRS